MIRFDNLVMKTESTSHKVIDQRWFSPLGKRERSEQKLKIQTMSLGEYGHSPCAIFIEDLLKKLCPSIDQNKDIILNLLSSLSLLKNSFKLNY